MCKLSCQSEKKKKYSFFVSEGKGKYVRSFVSEEFSKTLNILKMFHLLIQ